MKEAIVWRRGLICLAIVLSGCATDRGRVSDATLTVPALRETAAVASSDDAADDPAIWVNRARPSQSLIVATDKKAGLNVYDLTGAIKSSFPAGRVNNVDLRDNVVIGGKRMILVAASDRTDVAVAKLALFTLDLATAALTRLASLDAGAGEAYGTCLYRSAQGLLWAFTVMKDGTITQLALDVATAAPRGRIVREMKLATQSEGCVVDDRTDTLYVGEEAVGVWQFSARSGDGTSGSLIAPVDGKRIVADTEGVAIAASGARGGYLIVSSQGDSAYALYALPSLTYAGRFRIGSNGNGIGATSETDGIEVTTAFLGRDLRGGMMIAQDGDNAPNTQNFKMIGWDQVRKALKLPR